MFLSSSDDGDEGEIGEDERREMMRKGGEVRRRPKERIYFLDSLLPPMRMELPKMRLNLIRDPNPKVEADQRTLEMKSCGKSPNEEKAKFKMFKFARQDVAIRTTPHIKLIEHRPTKTEYVSDGVRCSIKRETQHLNKLLTPQMQSDFYQRNKDALLSETSFTLPSFGLNVDMSKAARKMFSSILRPNEDNDEGKEEEIKNQNIEIKVATNMTVPAPILPPVSCAHVYDMSIAKFELYKIIQKMPFICRVSPFSSSVQLGVNKENLESAASRIVRIDQLRLTSGEYTMIEYLDEKPIIQPLIGMASNLSILTVSSNASNHPYDQRIPVFTLKANGPSPFIAKIPKNNVIISLINEVCSSVVYPYHMDSKTDFILCIGAKNTLLRMPETIYLSTKIESRVLIKFQYKIMQVIGNFFSKHSQPVDICKSRSIINGVKWLADKGVKYRFSVPLGANSIKGKITNLPQDLRNGIYQYINLLRDTPWHKSCIMMKARLGLLSGAQNLIDVMGNKKYLTQVLDQSFLNQIVVIQPNCNEKEDYQLNLSDIDEGNEEEDWSDVLEYIQCYESQHLFGRQPGHTKMKHLIDWKLIFPWVNENTKMRKVLLTTTYCSEDGVARCTLKYTRDPAQMKAIMSHEKTRSCLYDKIIDFQNRNYQIHSRYERIQNGDASDSDSF